MASSSSPALRALPRGSARVAPPVALAAWIVFASLLQLVRAPGLPAWRVLWTEDGTVFLHEALTRSFPSALGTTYAGYLHIGPRLLVEPATWFPLDAAAAIIAVGAAIATSLLAAYVWVASRSFLETPRARALLVALFLCAPASVVELAGTAANLHWYGLVASFCALLHRPATRREAAAATAVVALTALSDPMLALLLPLLVLRPGGLRRPQLGARIIPSAAVAGLAIQAVAILGATGPERQSSFAPLDLPGIYAQRVAGPALAGDAWSGQLWLAIGWASAWAALALLAALAVRAVTTGAPERRRHALLAAMGSLVLFAVPLAIRGTAEMAPQLGELFTGGARYTFAPLVLAWVPALLLADHRAGWARWVATLVVVVVAASTVGVTDRSTGPDWADSLADARRTCATGAATATERVAPLSSVWVVTLPCNRL
jgi:hypothetical protein